ncbi:MAG: DUF4032 domain-containing protein [Ancrocorticia sp.]|uniref:DUF4032 domain-containing protein n=1 Tax=Ancrocorticia sp. TaxID=2593684 RepID=UPI003F91B756
MNPSLQIMAAQVDPELFDLPWNTPLTDWPEELIAALPRGISRHTVRFVYLGERIIAVKEIGETVAYKEYEMLRDLGRHDAPAVEPVAVVTGRSAPDGERLNDALVTEHLAYSLPYRAIFGQHQRKDSVRRLIDALSVLMVRLHLLGFFWGDVSLSNTLFRRDAGEFAAYLVDAETGELYPSLTRGKRDYDVDVARTNIIGELMDLQAGEILQMDVDAIEVGDFFVKRYTDLWADLTQTTTYSTNERWKIAERIRRLNDLGFEVGELSMSSDQGGTQVSIQPKVVDAGHFSRKIMRLTGMDVEENQARRMMNDIEQYRVTNFKPGTSQAIAAHEWMTKVYEPTINAIPRELHGKLEPAEIFHQLLEHRWYMSENAGYDVPGDKVIASFIEHVLRHKPNEHSFIGKNAEEVLGPDTADMSGMAGYFA